MGVTSVWDDFEPFSCNKTTPFETVTVQQVWWYWLRSYIIEQARLLRQKTENRYLAVLVAAWGVNRCRKALFGVASRPDTPTAVLGGETVEH